MPSIKKASVASLDKKRKAALNLLSEKKLDALLIEDPNDLFYWTGLHISMGSLLITKKSTTLFVDGRYLQMCQERTPLKVRPHTAFCLKGNIGFDSACMVYNRFLQIKKKAMENRGRLKSIENLGQLLRTTKLDYELTAIEKACNLALAAMKYVHKNLIPGVTEIEVAESLDLFFKKHGATPSFSPIIAFDTNSAMPHSEPSKKMLKKNDMALIDLGCKLGGYCSDMTRTFLIGKKDKKQAAIYSAVKAALDSILEKIEPGVTPKELDEIARTKIKAAGFEPYPHSLGHGVGIEVHELPLLRMNGKRPLSAGMVVTIEPGVYIEGCGGVRLENQVLILKDGYKNLTPYPFEKAL